MGLFNNTELGVKFCNSFIGMLYYDTGARSQAASFLQKGYVIADNGKEFGYKNSNALTSSSDAIYSAVASGVQFQLNQYSPSFRDNRVPQDTFRRFPSNWFVPQSSLANNTSKINYFYPVATGSGGGGRHFSGKSFGVLSHHHGSPSRVDVGRCRGHAKRHGGTKNANDNRCFDFVENACNFGHNLSRRPNYYT